MTGIKGIAIGVLLAGVACAQEIPPGTAFPVWLNSTLDSNKVQAGQAITGMVAQDVPLPSKAKIRAGSHVSGRVVKEGRRSDGSLFIQIRFDRLEVNGRQIPISTSLRALASPHDVQEAQLPKYGSVRGDSAATWTTTQIGGDDVYRGGGHVMHDDKVVGDPVKDGVLSVLVAVPRPGCGTASGDRRLALWVFSSSACGVYGFRHLDIPQAGDASPVGDIVLRSWKSVHVGTGSALLLITTEGPESHP